MDAPTFRFMPRAEVLDTVGFSNTALYERIKNKSFPAPVALGKQCVRWRSDEVAAWMERQSENRDVDQEERVTKARAAALQSVKKRSTIAALMSGGAAKMETLPKNDTAPTEGHTSCQCSNLADQRPQSSRA